jgi:hypothetical protein
MFYTACCVLPFLFYRLFVSHLVFVLLCVGLVAPLQFLAFALAFAKLQMCHQ